MPHLSGHGGSCRSIPGSRYRSRALTLFLGAPVLALLLLTRSGAGFFDTAQKQLKDHKETRWRRPPVLDAVFSPTLTRPKKKGMAWVFSPSLCFAGNTELSASLI